MQKNQHIPLNRSEQTDTHSPVLRIVKPQTYDQRTVYIHLYERAFMCSCVSVCDTVCLCVCVCMWIYACLWETYALKGITYGFSVIYAMHGIGNGYNHMCDLRWSNAVSTSNEKRNKGKNVKGDSISKAFQCESAMGRAVTYTHSYDQ